MNKLDLKKTLDSYKAKHNVFQIVTIPKYHYLMVDGHGDPNTSKEFAAAIEALYPVAYKLKFASKIQLGKDYTVMPLEGLWWSTNLEAFSTQRDKSQWDWTLMILQPDWITNDMFAKAIEEVRKKKALQSLDKVRFEMLEEGTCVQTLHIGSFDDEGPVLKQMHQEFIPQNNLRIVQKHHEIYLSDFRRVSPDKLRTILRQPVSAKR